MLTARNWARGDCVTSFICSSKSYFLISLSCTTLSIIIERKFAIKARKYHIFTRKYYSHGTSITYVEKRFIYVKEVLLKQTACHTKHRKSCTLVFLRSPTPRKRFIRRLAMTLIETCLVYYKFFLMAHRLEIQTRRQNIQ